VQTGVGSDASFVASDEESDDDPPVMYASVTATTNPRTSGLPTTPICQ
jgi:hypothetical protein